MEEEFYQWAIVPKELGEPIGTISVVDFGLRYEGTLRKSDWSKQGIVDACMYGMLASEYFKK